jgi:trk system potassium uptake protein
VRPGRQKSRCRISRFRWTSPRRLSEYVGVTLQHGQTAGFRKAEPTFWPFWAMALGIAVAEWVLPLHWWWHGPLTAVAVALSFVWLVRIGAMLRRVETPGRALPVVRNWSLAGLLLLVQLYLITQAAKGWLLRELFLGRQLDTVLAGYRSFVLVGLLLNGLALSLRPRPIQRFLLAVVDHTARLVALSFGGTILLGAFLLMLPVSVRSAGDISPVNALFTAASAVCVTGLAVNPIARTYTPFGQAVLLGLVQIGGFGIMALYGAVVALAGRRMSTRSARLMSEVVDVASLASVRRLLWGIIVFTLAVEGLGAVGFYCFLQPFTDVGAGPGADLPRAGAGNLWWASAFLSVSAFCNAGFSLFRDGLVPFVDNWVVSLLVMLLVVIGGLGFPVWFELLGRFWSRLRGRRAERLSLHSRTVLIVTGLLLLLGTLMYLVLEWGRSMKELPLHAKLLAAAFQSVVTRTAGFNSIDYSKMASATWLGTCVLMFIGASPGSTGGGIKTTTFAVLVAATWADLRRRGRVELGHRSIADIAVRRAVGVTLISGGALLVITFLLQLTEPFEPLRLGFEAASALATVGLSTGVTPELSAPGKLIVTTAMYLGRIGPLTLAMALASNTSPRAIGLPEERIGIG